MKSMGPALGISFVAFIVVTIVVYFLGGVVEESMGTWGAMDIGEWDEIYQKSVAITGILSMLCAMAWSGRVYNMDTLDSFGNRVNPRGYWVMLFLASLVISLAVPFVIKMMAPSDYHLHMLNILLGAGLFLLTFFLVTVVGTPSKFKYAPVGAELIRG